MIKLYSYKKCSTCRKAERFLNENHVDVKVVPIVESPPSKSELKIALESYQNNVKKLFNTSGVRYKELDLKSKLEKLTVDEALNLLSKEGKLIKRPFLVSENKAIVGFNEELWGEFLKK